MAPLDRTWEGMVAAIGHTARNAGITVAINLDLHQLDRTDVHGILGKLDDQRTGHVRCRSLVNVTSCRDYNSSATKDSLIDATKRKVERKHEPTRNNKKGL